MWIIELITRQQINTNLVMGYLTVIPVAPKRRL
jgi:hypothetical protein